MWASSVMCEWRVLPNGTVIGVSPARDGPALIWRGGCRGMPGDPADDVAEFTVGRGGGVSPRMTAHKRAHMTAHKNGHALVLEVRDVSAGPGGLFLALAARAGRIW